MRINAELPLPADLKAEYPLSEEIRKIKAERDQEIRDIFTGKIDKFVVIVGPCSADNEDSVCEYVERLAKINEKVSDRLMIIPRIYTNKPRTTGEGYKGMLHQPKPDQAPDLLAGIIAIRKKHIRASPGMILCQIAQEIPDAGHLPSFRIIPEVAGII